MMRGRVQWFSLERRYGFIDCEDGSSIFFHQNQMAEDHPSGTPSPAPFKGDLVSYETEISARSNRLHAIDVRVISPPASASPKETNRNGIRQIAKGKLPWIANEGREGEGES